ncbi:hypothetical protein CWN92_11185 [Vibrio splendidus]|nr:hypothetical protein CWN92_11185 [Vibrio splendidus]
MRLKSFLCQTTIGIRNDVILVVGLGFLISDGIMGTRWLGVMRYEKPYVEVIWPLKSRHRGLVD